MQCFDDGSRLEPQQCSSDQWSSVSEEKGISISEGHKKRQKSPLLSSKTKERAKKILHLKNRRSSLEGANSEGIGIIKNDPAFNTGLLEKQEQQHTTTHEPAKKTLKNLQSAATAVIHPIESIKKKATKITAGKLSNSERPYLSRNADLDFLNAHKELDQAYSLLSSQHKNPEHEEDETTHDCRSKVVGMEAQRESLRVAWITSKHISRVRVVPKRHIKYPNTAEFYLKDSNGSLQRFEWLKWLGYV